MIYPVHNRRFCKWSVCVKDKQFVIGEQGFACPTIEFNVNFPSGKNREIIKRTPESTAMMNLASYAGEATE